MAQNHEIQLVAEVSAAVTKQILKELVDQLKASRAGNDETDKHKKKIEDAKKKLDEFEKRVPDIQSTAFQLVNYYFVFQGVILVVLCNSETSLKCTDRWFLLTLSLLSGTLNLMALLAVGGKYRRILSQQEFYWNEYSQLVLAAAEIEKREGTPTSAYKPKEIYLDPRKKVKHYVIQCVCMGLLIGFAVCTGIKSYYMLC